MLLANSFAILLALAASAAAAATAPKAPHHQQHQPNYQVEPSAHDQPRLLSRLFGTTPKSTVYYKLADGTILARPPSPESLLDFEVLTSHRDEHSGSLIDIDLLRRNPDLGAFATTGDIIQKVQPVPAAMPPLPVHARQFVTDGNSVTEEPGHEHKKSDKHAKGEKKHSQPSTSKGKNGSTNKPKSKAQPKPAKKPSKKTQQRPHKSSSGQQQQQFGAKAVSHDPASSTSPTSTSTMDVNTSESVSATSTPATTSSTDMPTLPVAAPSAPTGNQVVNLDLAMQRRADQFVQQVMIQRRHDHGEKSGKGASDHAKGQSSDATSSTSSTSTTATATSTSSSYSDAATATPEPAATPLDSDMFDDSGFSLHGLRQGAIHVSAIFGDAKLSDASASSSDDSTQSAQPTATDDSSSTSADPTTTSSSSETASVTTSNTSTVTDIPIPSHVNVIDLSVNIHQRRVVDTAALESTTGSSRAILRDVVQEVVAEMPCAKEHGVDSIHAHDAAHAPTSRLPTGLISSLPTTVTAIPASIASAATAPIVGVVQ